MSLDNERVTATSRLRDIGLSSIMAAMYLSIVSSCPISLGIGSDLGNTYTTSTEIRLITGKKISASRQTANTKKIMTLRFVSTHQKQSKNDGLLVEEFIVTAFCSCSKCCGHSHGITKSGRRATEGRTVACDKRMLGKIVWIDGLGPRVCEDTGKKIRGHRMDLFLKTHREALEFGKRKMRVRVF